MPMEKEINLVSLAYPPRRLGESFLERESIIQKKNDFIFFFFYKPKETSEERAGKRPGMSGCRSKIS